MYEVTNLSTSETLRHLRASLNAVAEANLDGATSRAAIGIGDAKDCMARLEQLNKAPKSVIDWAVADVVGAIENVVKNLAERPTNHEEIAELQKIKLWVEAAGYALNARTFQNEWTPSSGDSQ